MDPQLWLLGNVLQSVCVRKWATPLWTSVKAGSGLTVNCMCRMGRSRRHNYTNPLLISGSVGKLTRNDARDVASPSIPNERTLQQALALPPPVGR